MNIGENIRALREAQKINQAELAKMIGVTPSMLCQIERGSKALSLPLAVVIANTLGCSIENITGVRD